MFTIVKIKPWLAYFLLAGLSVISQATQAQSSVWKISKDQDHFYLGGTLHLLSETDYPLPPEFDQAYQGSDTLIFETSLDAMESPAFQQQFLSAMTYADERTLEGSLKPGTYRSLLRYMLSRKIPIQQFANFKPWGVSLTIAMLEYQRLGILPEYGVDRVFSEKALEDNKGIKALETPEQQLAFLSSMAQVDPNVSVNNTLRELKHLPRALNEITEAWRNGDMDAFGQSSYIEDMRNLLPKVYQTIVVERNNNWMTLLPRLTDNNEKEFVLVGTLHMVGKEGLLAQLKQQGFTVEAL